MPAKLYIQIASCLPKLSSWIDGILLITTHPVGLGTRGPIMVMAAPYFHFIQIQWKSTSEKEKHGKKHSFSDGKRFPNLVLLSVLLTFRPLWLTAEI
jgi:hypothetical protein